MMGRLLVNIKRYGYLLFPLIMSIASQQSAADSINLRLSTGISSIDTNYSFSGQNKDESSRILQIMHHIDEGGYFPHSWGLELGNFSVLSSNSGNLDYDTVSIFVEASPLKSVPWLRTSIGTAGYLGNGVVENDVFGIRVSAGAEIPLNNRFSFIGFVRRDTIHDTEKTNIVSIQLGVQLRLK